MKTLCLLALAFLIADCGKSKPPQPQPTPVPTVTPTPEPTPTAAPTVEPSPSPLPTASPVVSPSPTPSPTPQPSPVDVAPLPVRFPVPAFNPQDFIRSPIVVETITVNTATGDPSTLINAVQSASYPGPVTISIQGGGSIKTPVRLRHNTRFDDSEYFCDVPGYRCFTIDDQVMVEGTWRPHATLVKFWDHRTWENLQAVQALTPEQMAGKGTIIWEPTHFDEGGRPAIEVFMPHGQSLSLQGEVESRGITILGFHIKGRQTKCDGGVRQTFAMGNCVNCAMINNYLEGTGSIGLQFGGSSATGNRARDSLIYRNVTTNMPAAHVACVNCERVITSQHYAFRIGAGQCGGGISGYDLETNTEGDWAKDNWVDSSVWDFADSPFGQSAGNGINLNDPGNTPSKNGDNSAVNNWIFGARTRDTKTLYISNCLLVSQLNRTTVSGNYCFKTAQTGLSWFGTGEARGQGSIVEGNVFDSTGGGGGPSVFLNENTEGVTIKKNLFWKHPDDKKQNTDFRMWDCGKNSATKNFLNGVEISLTREGCATNKPLNKSKR